jgi:acetyl-CoA acetyltransferase
VKHAVPPRKARESCSSKSSSPAGSHGDRHVRRRVRGSPGPKLGAAAIKAALQRSGVPADQIDEVIFGNVVSAGSGRTSPGSARWARD